jgi:hypothetical protein
MGLHGLSQGQLYIFYYQVYNKACPTHVLVGAIRSLLKVSHAIRNKSFQKMKVI